MDDYEGCEIDRVSYAPRIYYQRRPHRIRFLPRPYRSYAQWPESYKFDKEDWRRNYLVKHRRRRCPILRGLR